VKSREQINTGGRGSPGGGKGGYMGRVGGGVLEG